MTNNSDSSAPNSPEVTRLSGEQAEGRTAREGRKLAKGWREENGYIALHLRMGEPPVFEEKEVDHLLAAYAKSECSRLASRVDELEKCLREMTEIAKGYRVIGYDHKFLRAAIDKAESLLAGAHAEEKSK